MKKTSGASTTPHPPPGPKLPASDIRRPGSRPRSKLHQLQNRAMQTGQGCHVTENNPRHAKKQSRQGICAGNLPHPSISLGFAPEIAGEIYFALIFADCASKRFPIMTE